MPFAFETDKKRLPASFDRRRKLTDEDKANIRTSTLSQRKLAEHYGVSRRLVTFVLHPEKQAENLRRREERGGWRAYYSKEKQRDYMRGHRRYKQFVLACNNFVEKCVTLSAELGAQCASVSIGNQFTGHPPGQVFYLDRIDDIVKNPPTSS